MLGSFDQAFQYIQNFTGFFTPGICVLFLLGLFWKKATANGALAAALVSFVASIAFFFAAPNVPFMDRVAIVFLLSFITAIFVSILEGNKDQEKAVDLEGINFKTKTSFNIATLGVIAILIALYATWW